VCGKKSPATMLNAEMNAHLDKCLADGAMSTDVRHADGAMSLCSGNPEMGHD
jgi:hypothetical protein